MSFVLFCVVSGGGPDFPLTADSGWHGYSGVVKESTGEWNDAMLSSVMRVGSVCMRVMKVHMYGVHLVSVILRSAFAKDTLAPPQASWCEGSSVTTRGVPAG